MGDATERRRSPLEKLNLLSAEGARRKPNLSGKRTEAAHFCMLGMRMRSLPNMIEPNRKVLLIFYFH